MNQTHCGHCGTKFEQESGWPRDCASCGQTTWKNPLPAVMVLVTVIPQPGATGGLLCVRRGIDPQKGKLCLPGGFLEVGETWREAAVRELQEETGLSLSPNSIRLYSVEDGTRRDRILLFGWSPMVYLEDLPAFSPSEEVLERVVIMQPQKLAFASHTEVMERFFDQYLDGPPRL